MVGRNTSCIGGCESGERLYIEEPARSLLALRTGNLDQVSKSRARSCGLCSSSQCDSWSENKDRCSPNLRIWRSRIGGVRKATSNKCHASSNKCLTSSNKKLLNLNSFRNRSLGVVGPCARRDAQDAAAPDALVRFHQVH